MKKLLSLLLAGAMMFSLAACGDKPADDAENTSADGYEIALITDLGSIDDKSFNQGCWEGVVKYAEEKEISHKYYKPTEKSTDAYVEAIDLAVTGGAKVIVTPGFLFEEPIKIAQEKYPDVKFILIDGSLGDAIADNTVAITYAENESGFLAGYAAVKEGLTNLGFVGGMAVPAVVRFGIGYVQGAEYAANELGLDDGAISVKYNYCGEFGPKPEIEAMAASWYNSGTEVIFAAAGGAGNSVMAAAEKDSKAVIGVDVDQSAESETVITSATKELKEIVYKTLGEFYSDAFPGGKNLVLTAADAGVKLPMETSKFKTFTQEDYDAVFAKLAAGELDIDVDVEKASDDLTKYIEELGLKKINFTEVK